MISTRYPIITAARSHKSREGIPRHGVRRKMWSGVDCMSPNHVLFITNMRFFILSHLSTLVEWCGCFHVRCISNSSFLLRMKYGQLPLIWALAKEKVAKCLPPLLVYFNIVSYCFSLSPSSCKCSRTQILIFQTCSLIDFSIFVFSSFSFLFY